MMAVAKSYQSYQIIGEPYQKSGKMYVLIKHPSTGNTREARWYNDQEYSRLYPGEETKVTRLRSVKDVLGFKYGYITIFKGDTFSVIDWFRESPARYHKLWGWYVVSEEETEITYPAGITPVKLYWEQIARAGEDALKDETSVREVVESLMYEESPSQFQGAVGDRIDRVLTVVKVIPQEGYYGLSNKYIFEDEEQNIYVWSTGSKFYGVGETHKLRGTIKDLITFRATKQTVLTRCKEL